MYMYKPIDENILMYYNVLICYNLLYRRTQCTIIARDDDAKLPNPQLQVFSKGSLRIL